MDIITAVDRLNEDKPRMQEIADTLAEKLSGAVPHISIKADDNLMSCVHINGSYDPKESWQSNIYYNSRYFMFMISPPNGDRWYEGGAVTVELIGYGQIGRKFRKYTGSPDKVIEKIVTWING